MKTKVKVAFVIAAFVIAGVLVICFFGIVIYGLITDPVKFFPAIFAGGFTGIVIWSMLTIYEYYWDKKLKP